MPCACILTNPVAFAAGLYVDVSLQCSPRKGVKTMCRARENIVNMYKYASPADGMTSTDKFCPHTHTVKEKGKISSTFWSLEVFWHIF